MLYTNTPACMPLQLAKPLAQTISHLTTYPGIASHITLVEIDHEVHFFGHSLPSVDLRRAVVSYWQKYVHKYWLTTQRTKPAKKSVSGLSDWLDMLNSIGWTVKLTPVSMQSDQGYSVYSCIL